MLVSGVRSGVRPRLSWCIIDFTYNKNAHIGGDRPIHLNLYVQIPGPVRYSPIANKYRDYSRITKNRPI